MSRNQYIVNVLEAALYGEDAKKIPAQIGLIEAAVERIEANLELLLAMRSPAIAQAIGDLRKE